MSIATSMRATGLEASLAPPSQRTVPVAAEASKAVTSGGVLSTWNGSLNPVALRSSPTALPATSLAVTRTR